MSDSVERVSSNINFVELDYLDLEPWNHLNDLLRETLGHQRPIATRFLHGIGSGAIEILTSLSQFYSHKKSVVFLNDQSSFLKLVTPSFYKQMYQVHLMSSEIFLNGNHLSVNQGVDSLPQDTLFVFYSEDHPITSQKYEWEALDNALNAKKIFSIRLSHRSHFFLPEAPQSYSVRICSYERSKAVAVLGDKFKAPPLFSHVIPIQYEEILSTTKKMQSSQTENQDLVIHFENNISDIATVYFKEGIGRYYDRSVLIFPQINAEALIVELENRIPGSSSSLFTTSLCHFEGFNLDIFKGVFGPGEGPDFLSGLIVISIDLLKNDNFIKNLRASHQEVLRLQNWD